MAAASTLKAGAPFDGFPVLQSSPDFLLVRGFPFMRSLYQAGEGFVESGVVINPAPPGQAARC
jgi:hypothetical protein